MVKRETPFLFTHFQGVDPFFLTPLGSGREGLPLPFLG